MTFNPTEQVEVDHQPLAVAGSNGYQSGCICGWRGTGVYVLRSEALVMARAAHDDKVSKIVDGHPYGDRGRAPVQASGHAGPETKGVPSTTCSGFQNTARQMALRQVAVDLLAVAERVGSFDRECDRTLGEVSGLVAWLKGRSGRNQHPSFSSRSAGPSETASIGKGQPALPPQGSAGHPLATVPS